MNKLLLIVEDNEDAILYFKEALKRKNVKALYANNGKNAVEIFDKNKDNIELILMDVRLPDMNGYDASTEILKIKNVPIIIQTACVSNIEKEKSLSIGCVDFLTKPIGLYKLYKILDKYSLL